MNHRISRRALLGLGASALSLAALPSFAQGSDKPVRIVLQSGRRRQRCRAHWPLPECSPRHWR